MMQNDLLDMLLAALRVTPTTLVVIGGLAMNYRHRREQPRVFDLFVLAGLFEFSTILFGFVWQIFGRDLDSDGQSQFVAMVIYLTIVESLNAICWGLMLWAVLRIERRPGAPLLKPD